MYKITKQDISEFKRIYLDKFGIEISDDFANQRLTALLIQVEILHRNDERYDNE